MPSVKSKVRALGNVDGDVYEYNRVFESALGHEEEFEKTDLSRVQVRAGT